MSLVSPDNTWTLVAIIASGVTLSVYLEENYRWAAKVSGPVIALLLAMLLTNLPVDRLLRLTGSASNIERILPAEAPAYDMVTRYLVPVAVVLLLLQANLRKILTTSRTMFIAFHLAAAGTLVGNVLAAVIFRDAVGHLPEASGLMAASYIGGGVNFIAVQRTYDVDPNVVNPLLVADNFVMAGFFFVLLFIVESKLFRRFYPHPHVLAAERSGGHAGDSLRKAKELDLLDLAGALAVAFCIAAAAAQIAQLAKAWTETIVPADSARQELLGAVLGSLVGSQFVWLTLLSVTVATVVPKTMERLKNADVLGMYLLYAFLFVIGLPADLVKVLLDAPVMFGFCAVIAVANLAVALLAGKLLRLNLEELLLAVNATLGGPPTAAAMAAAKGWDKLVLPALLIGIWGYVIGTFVGIVVVESFRRWLG